MMAHFAQLDDTNTVVQVVVVDNALLLDENGFEVEQPGKEFCHNLFGGNWIQTSYSGSFRKQYAVIGGTYDPVRDIFIGIKPYPSWYLSESGDWVAPVPRPTDGIYEWDEDSQTWLLVE